MLFFIRLQPESSSDPWSWICWLSGSALLMITGSVIRRPRTVVRLITDASMMLLWLISWILSPTVQLWQFSVLLCATLLWRGGRKFWLLNIAINGKPKTEILRWLLLGLSGIVVIHPYATRSLVGGGDAQLYAHLLADFLEQLHAGVFPVLIGQGSLAFNGEIHPLRTAPGFFYLGGLLDFITLRSLSAVTLQNLLITLSFLASIFVCYGCAVRLAPRQGWTAWLMTMLFLTSPGVLALIYAGDMVASWMTLPWLPLLFFYSIRLADNPNSLAGPARVTVVLAILWWLHAPIAFWVTVCMIPFAGWHLIRSAAKHDHLIGLVGCLGLFLLLTGFVFWSVKTLAIPANPNLRIDVENGAIQSSIQQMWEGFLRPVSPSGSHLLSDLQLSPGQWLALAIGVLGGGRVARASHRLLLGTAGMLILLLVPPMAPVWALMPDVVLNATEKWPTQRFLVILASIVPLVALPVLAHFRCDYPKFVRDVTIVLVLACAWSGLESAKFIRRGWAVTHTADATRRKFLPENVQLPRYSYEYFGSLPRYHTQGPANVLTQVRLLDLDSLEPRLDNARWGLAQDSPPEAIELLHGTQTDYGGIYQPLLPLPAGENYLLHFAFPEAAPNGVLQLRGHDLQAEYAWPSSGEERAFGAGPHNDPTLIIGNHSSVNELIDFRFVRTPGTKPSAALPSIQAIPFSQDQLPLQITKLIPFRMTVLADQPSWLETPKLFVPGYEARVDGQPVTVAKSPDGLVMLPVPQGKFEVELSYPGPFGLTALFWIGTGTLLVVLLFWRAPVHWLSVLKFTAPGMIMLRLGQITLVALLSTGLAWGGFSFWHVFSEGFDTDGRLSVHRQFPFGKIGVATDPLLQINHALLRGRFVLDCLDGKRARIGFISDQNAEPIFGEPFPVNYLAKQHLQLQWEQEPSTALQLRVNHRKVLAIPVLD